MERIKEAIEKAKSQRGSPSAQVRKPELRVARPQIPVADHGPHIELDAEVQYRQTPVVQLDPVHLENHRIVAQQKEHPASRAFDLLRTQVLQKMDENGWRTLAITSPTMESGKTLVAINLAISIAQQTNRTSLLVDFDFRRPRVASSLGLQGEVSLNQVLASSARVEEAMVNPGIPRFVVLPTQRPIPSSAEALGSSKVAALMGELREHYSDRIVVVDLPPVLAADDVLAVLPRIDCVLMVVGNGVSSRREIEESMSRLSKFPMLGVVLNKDDAPVGNAYY